MWTYHQIRLELILFFRNRAYVGLMLLLLILMTLAAWNTNLYTQSKKEQTSSQLALVRANDARLVAEIDSLNRGLATYESSYSLPTSGVRLTYNNHRLAWLPIQPFSLIAIGQGDLFSNYKKIVLYFDDSYEMASEELVSPLEQLFGQLDLTFVWVYLLPLIILLMSFNVLSIERETGRLTLIASQPIRLSTWVIQKIGIRFLTIYLLITVFTIFLLGFFGVSIKSNLATLGQLFIMLFLYTAFWFLLSFLVNLCGYSSGRSLILLTSAWVFFVFLVPSVVNQLAKELHPIPSRLEVVNHHQTMYNEMENNLEAEMEKLYQRHPDWRSDDPVTADLSNSTGWNIQYLGKQYLAQLKHRAVADNYESVVEERNTWVENFRILSPALIVQSALVGLAGTSSKYYRSFLRQAIEYADGYRQYVFKRVFTNHTFTVDEVKSLPRFEFDRTRVNKTFGRDFMILLVYLFGFLLACYALSKQTLQIK